MNQLATTQKKELDVNKFIEIALTNNADLDKLEKLLDIQERYEQKQAKSAYLIALSKFKEKCPTITKSKKGHNYMYAGLAETIDQIKDGLSDSGFCFSWQIDQQDSMIKVTCFLNHIDGHTETASLQGSPDTSGSKNSIQAVGSTVAYLERYTLYAILGLSSMDMDSDAMLTKDTISKEQIEVLNEKLSKVDNVKFENWLSGTHGVNNIESLPKEKFDVVISTLNKKIKVASNGNS